MSTVDPSHSERGRRNNLEILPPWWPQAYPLPRIKRTPFPCFPEQLLVFMLPGPYSIDCLFLLCCFWFFCKNLFFCTARENPQHAYTTPPSDCGKPGIAAFLIGMTLFLGDAVTANKSCGEFALLKMPLLHFELWVFFQIFSKWYLISTFDFRWYFASFLPMCLDRFSTNQESPRHVT